MDVAADDGIIVLSPTITTDRETIFRSDVLFASGSGLSANQIRFDAPITTADATTTTITAPIVDPAAATALVKTGSGTLVLTAINGYTVDTQVNAGTLRVQGTIASPASQVRVATGGRLEGSGRIEADVLVDAGGRIAPGVQAGDQESRLVTGNLTLAAGSIYELQISGLEAGVDYDQIEINHADAIDNGVSIDNAILDLTLDADPPPASEFILISNDHVDPISGHLAVNFDTAGAPLANPRVLNQGDLVLAPFGTASASAFITYFGGDGNDITLVTSGDATVAADAVTIVSRRGTDIEIRTGEDFQAAQNASPTVRPIAGLNNNDLIIQGRTGDNQFFFDANDFVDSSGQSINFNGNIIFAGDPSGRDELIVLDSDLASSDVQDSFGYQFTGSREGVVTVDTPGTVPPHYTLSFTELESLQQQVATPTTDLQYSQGDDELVIQPDPNAPTRTLLTNRVGGQVGTSLSVLNPTESLTLATGDGDDQVMINGFGSAENFSTPIVFDGEAGVDALSITTDLQLGTGPTVGRFDATAEKITLSGSIDTTGGTNDGELRLTGGDAIVIDAGATLTTGLGTINIDGNGGSVDSSDGVLMSDFAGDAITIHDATTVTIGDVAIPIGRFVLGIDQDVSGPVTQATSTSIAIDRLTASSSNAISLANPSNQIRLIDGLLTNGEILINDSAADLTVTAVDSSGHDLAIRTSGTMLLANDAINATGASVTLTADGAIDDSDPDDPVANISASIVNLTAGDQGIGQNGTSLDVLATDELNANTRLFNGDIHLANVGGALPVGQIDAGVGKIMLIADSVDDATLDSVADITGSELVVTAIAGIGSARPLELLSVDQLTATTISGGINFDSVASQRTTLELLSTQSGDIRLSQSGGHRLDVITVDNQAGSIQLTNLDESIDLTGDPAVAGGIATAATGEIELVARGDTSDVVVRLGIESESGNVRLIADRNIVFSDTGDVRSTDGLIEIRGDDRDGDFAGTVSMSDGTVIDAGIGTISLMTDGNIDLGGLVTANASPDAVIVSSQSGAITDRGDQDVDIDAADGTVTLHSRSGTGDSDAIETQISVLNSEVTGRGSTQLNEADSIQLASVATADGRIVINAGGTITAIDVQSSNANNTDDAAASGGADSRDIHLSATGNQSDILVHQITAAGPADIFLTAADDVLDVDDIDDRRVVGDDLLVVAGNDTDDQDIAIGLSTTVQDFEALVSGPNRGDIDIHETDSINLAASDRGDDTEQIATGNGEIRITADASIHIADPDGSNESVDLSADPELIAGGDNGRLRLTATDSILIDDAVQLQVSQSTIDAVLIQSTAIQLGENIQISTGQGVGVARVFAPRPDIDLTETAFYESTTITTNTLEQAAINDAEGLLTVDIGKPGERGLTINIDWGAAKGRFQQIDGLSGDAPPLVVSHVYLEDDILNSQFNDRTAGTKPLNVKFAVRHHESIRVLGSSVTQAGSPVEPVDGLVVSSTDNPLTAQSEQVQILESGTASFIIPSLSIPVAFFPVRDVIPESEDPQVFVRQETTTTTVQSQFETTESAVVTSVSRQEYFQIRALSPNPEVGDLAAPERLPDDILDGDTLRDLFARLPDGRYEIQYVLGDGNERSILQVELRDGSPTIAADELDGGPMKLRLIEDNDDDSSNSAPDQDPPGKNQINDVIDKLRDQVSAQTLQSNGVGVMIAGQVINVGNIDNTNVSPSEATAGAAVAVGAGAVPWSLDGPSSLDDPSSLDGPSSLVGPLSLFSSSSLFGWRRRNGRYSAATRFKSRWGREGQTRGKSQ
ncbi:MAG: hypothetical protein HKN47_13475 [Pirellulaceae bacterium]|nr:hypothetical protein [Pirellulaceae bacterium]